MKCYADKRAKKLAKRVRVYGRAVFEYEAEKRRIEYLRVAADPRDMHLVVDAEAELAAKAVTLSECRAEIVDECRDLGAGFDLPVVS